MLLWSWATRTVNWGWRSGSGSSPGLFCHGSVVLVPLQRNSPKHDAATPMVSLAFTLLQSRCVVFLPNGSTLVPSENPTFSLLDHRSAPVGPSAGQDPWRRRWQQPWRCALCRSVTATGSASVFHSLIVAQPLRSAGPACWVWVSGVDAQIFGEVRLGQYQT